MSVAVLKIRQRNFSNGLSNTGATVLVIVIILLGIVLLTKDLPFLSRNLLKPLRELAEDMESIAQLSSFDRCLVSVEGLGFTTLKVGDRLEPSINCPDIGLGFDACRSYPFRVTFWREELQSWAYHRNPLWEPTLGLTVDRVMMVDFLHTVGLG